MTPREIASEVSVLNQRVAELERELAAPDAVLLSRQTRRPDAPEYAPKLHGMGDLVNPRERGVSTPLRGVQGPSQRGIQPPGLDETDFSDLMCEFGTPSRESSRGSDMSGGFD